MLSGILGFWGCTTREKPETKEPLKVILSDNFRDDGIQTLSAALDEINAIKAYLRHYGITQVVSKNFDENLVDLKVFLVQLRNVAYALYEMDKTENKKAKLWQEAGPQYSTALKTNFDLLVLQLSLCVKGCVKLDSNLHYMRGDFIPEFASGKMQMNIGSVTENEELDNFDIVDVDRIKVFLIGEKLIVYPNLAH